MEPHWKIIIFIIILILFFWLNHKFNNIFVKWYNYCSRIPKMILIVVVLVSIFMPMLLKDNKYLGYVKDYLPDEIGSRLESVNSVPIMQPPQFLGVQQIPYGRKRGGITTRQLRNVSEQVKKSVAAGQYWKCGKCNAMLDATYEIDHMVALEDGGDNNINNLQALCRNCHGKKTMYNNISKRYPNGVIN